MSDIKPWQIVLIVAAIIVLAFTGLRVLGGERVQDGPSGYMTVDVLTGQLYLLKKGKARGMILPAKNPDTNERTLYPVDETESGAWELDKGYAEFMPEDLQEKSTILGKDFDLVISDEDPIVHTIR